MKNKNYFILLVLFLSALQIKAQYSFDNVLYGADLDIYDIIEDTMNAHKVIENPTLEEVLETEQWVYEHIESR